MFELYLKGMLNGLPRANSWTQCQKSETCLHIRLLWFVCVCVFWLSYDYLSHGNVQFRRPTDGASTIHPNALRKRTYTILRQREHFKLQTSVWAKGPKIVFMDPFGHFCYTSKHIKRPQTKCNVIAPTPVHRHPYLAHEATVMCRTIV